MRDERLDVFLPVIPRWKTHAKNALMFLYSWGLVSRQTTQLIVHKLGLELA